jgi:hypothetical protein
MVYVPNPPPDSIWIGSAVNSAPLSLLTAQEVFGAGGQVPTKLWRWDFDDQLPKWQGAPNDAAPIQLLTAQHFFTAGGSVSAKFWRCDYLIEFPQWQGGPGAAAPIPLLTAQAIEGAGGQGVTPHWLTIGDSVAPAWNTAPYNLALATGNATRPPLYRWRFDQIETAPQAAAAGAAPLRLLTAQKFFTAGGQAPAKLWRWDFDDQLPKWQGSPVNSVSIRLPAAQFFYGQSGEVPTKFWRYDFSSEGPPWAWQPLSSAMLADLLTDLGPARAVRWHHDLAEALPWIFSAQRARFLSSAAPFIASSWHREAIEGPYWAWRATAPIGALSAPAVTAPFSGSLWWPAPAQDAFWPGAPDAAAILINSLLIVSEREPLAARYIHGRSGPKRIIGRSGHFIKGRP